jgi:polysaccharide biosynthesis/export protein
MPHGMKPPCISGFSFSPALQFGLAAWLIAMVGCATIAPRGSGKSAVTPSAVSAVSAADSQERIRELWNVRTTNGMPVDFCLGPGDLVTINVFHYPEMTNLRARISETGSINLPLLGDVTASGLTEHELEEQIAVRLREGIMKNPQVTVFVDQQTSQQVSVTGAVGRPGLISLSRDNRSIADIISEAGGLTEQAGGKILLHPAKGRGGCLAIIDRTRPVQLASAQPPTALNPIEINLNEEYNPPNENPIYLPVIGGDSIVVNRGRFLIDGWVKSPGAFDISQGITLFGAISAAGGSLFPADLSDVIIWRSERDGSKQRIDVDVTSIETGNGKDITLQAGDVVYVRASFILMVPYTGYWLITNIIRFGAGVSLI